MNLILRRLANPTVDEAVLQGGANLFSKYVSDVNGGSVERYRRLLDEIIRGRS